MEKVLVLSSRNPETYQICKQLLAFVRDAEGLRKLFASLSRTELDLAKESKRAAELQEGKLDGLMKTTAQSAPSTLKPSCRWAAPRRCDARGGCVRASSRLGWGQPPSAFPSTQTRPLPSPKKALPQLPRCRAGGSLSSRCCFEHERLTRADQRFAELRDRTRRSISYLELVAGVLSLEGPLKKLALEDADVRLAVDLTRESFTASAPTRRPQRRT